MHGGKCHPQAEEILSIRPPTPMFTTSAQVSIWEFICCLILLIRLATSTSTRARPFDKHTACMLVPATDVHGKAYAP